MADQIRRAATVLRDSVAALSVYLRSAALGEEPARWVAEDGAMIIAGVTLHGIGYLSIDGETIEQEAAEHIARTASPDVVLALADLLDAIHAHHDATRVFDSAPQVAAYRAARDALARLEALITRGADA